MLVYAESSLAKIPQHRVSGVLSFFLSNSPAVFLSKCHNYSIWGFWSSLFLFLKFSGSLSLKKKTKVEELCLCLSKSRFESEHVLGAFCPRLKSRCLEVRILELFFLSKTTSCDSSKISPLSTHVSIFPKDHSLVAYVLISDWLILLKNGILELVFAQSTQFLFSSKCYQNWRMSVSASVCLKSFLAQHHSISDSWSSSFRSNTEWTSPCLFRPLRKTQIMLSLCSDIILAKVFNVGPLGLFFLSKYPAIFLSKIQLRCRNVGLCLCLLKAGQSV